jgi:hypothetical protein
MATFLSYLLQNATKCPDDSTGSQSHPLGQKMTLMVNTILAFGGKQLAQIESFRPLSLRGL